MVHVSSCTFVCVCVCVCVHVITYTPTVVVQPGVRALFASHAMQLYQCLFPQARSGTPLERTCLLGVAKFGCTPQFGATGAYVAHLSRLKTNWTCCSLSLFDAVQQYPFLEDMYNATAHVRDLFAPKTLLQPDDREEIDVTILWRPDFDVFLWAGAGNGCCCHLPVLASHQ